MIDTNVPELVDTLRDLLRVAGGVIPETSPDYHVVARAREVLKENAETPAITGDPGFLVAPDGVLIDRVVESMVTHYYIYDLERDGEGQVSFEYNSSQSSDDIYDTAEPRLTKHREFMFLDVDGREWRESQLIAVDDSNANVMRRIVEARQFVEGE